MTIATQSVFVFTIAIRSVNFFGRSFVGGNFEVAAGPLAQVDQLAARTAKWSIGIVFELNLVLASWTLHAGSRHDLSDQIVLEALCNFDVVKLAGLNLPVARVVDQNVTVNVGRLRLHPALEQKLRLF